MSLWPGPAGVAVLGRGNALLAGDAALASRAIRALEEAPGLRAVTARSASAALVVAREGDRAVAIDVPGPALAGLARVDLASALDLLQGR